MATIHALHRLAPALGENPCVTRPVFVALCAVALVTSACAWTSPGLPPGQAVAESSRVFATDGTLITTLHGEENREVVALAKVPKVVQDAVVAIEDERFWVHKGVDLRAVARAAASNASQGRVAEGGSTITQQYVKNELLGPERDVRRKLREASLAYHLEQRYSKSHILELYLNTIYFGNGAYGVQAAAHEYFGQSTDALGLAQAALLAGLIHAPTTLDPYDHAEAATARRRTVLDKMVSLRLVTRAQADEAAALPLGLRTKPDAERYAAPYFVERVKRFVLDDPRFGATPKVRRDLLFSGGLEISTTVDLAQQAKAESAVAKVLSSPDKDPEAAVVTIEPGTGYVRALVGGRDFFGGGAQAKLDLATQGTGRPAGSAFKPFVLAAALAKGMALSKTYDAPGRLTLTLPRSVWQVDNYEGNGGGRMNLVDATVQSVNTVYAQLVLDVGPAAAVQLASRMGITTALKPYPSAVLGTNEVLPLDMASAYGTFANRGVAVPPTLITKIVGRSGEILYQHKHTERRVLDADVVDTEVDVLRQVVERGTGVNAKIGRPVAGKTGTGQKWRDAWFVGFTPDLVTSVWVGFPKGQISMTPPVTRTLVSGGSWPARIWQLYMGEVLASTPVADFHPPPSFESGIDETPRPVPSLVGMPASQAELALSRNGLGMRRKSVPNRDYPPGYVVAQNPPAGANAAGGSIVTLSISAAPTRTADVPDVLGKPQADAVAALKAAGFSVDVQAQPEGDLTVAQQHKGLVWKQSPGGGGPADAGSTVVIWTNPA
jgi:penicillin-binding protein 1A